MALCTKLHHTVWVPGLSSIIYFTWANQARNVFPASFHLQTHLLHVFVTTADPAQLQTQISIALGWLKVLCPYNWQSSKLCRNDPMFALMEKGWILSTWTLYLWMKVTITEKKKKKPQPYYGTPCCLSLHSWNLTRFGAGEQKKANSVQITEGATGNLMIKLML